MSSTASSIDFADYALKAKLYVWTDRALGCWEWQGLRMNNGYGMFKYRGEVYAAHRVAWALANLEDPAGLSVDHMCHNKACVNPSHLRLATHKQNAEHMLPVRAKSGFRGVSQHGKKWRATVRHNGVAHHSKTFETAEEANAAAVALRNDLFTHNLLDR